MQPNVTFALEVVPNEVAVVEINGVVRRQAGAIQFIDRKPRQQRNEVGEGVVCHFVESLHLDTTEVVEDCLCGEVEHAVKVELRDGVDSKNHHVVVVFLPLDFQLPAFREETVEVDVQLRNN